MRSTLLQSALALALLCTSAAAWSQVAVIVSAKSPAGEMTDDQISGIFLGKSNLLPSGATAVPVDQPDSASVRETFYTKVTGKNSAQVKAAWSRLVFSGKAKLPKELGSDAEVRKFVAGNPDAIGYIAKSAVDSSVKVVKSVD